MSTKESPGPVSKARASLEATKGLEDQLAAAIEASGVDLGKGVSKASAKKKLKELPGFSQGVRVNSSVRMKKLAQPICPGSKMEFELDAAGVPRVVPKGPDNQNHQLLWSEYGPGWVEACEAAGHNPWFRKITWMTKEDDLEEIVKDGKSTGRFRKVGEIIIPNSVDVPNVTQVAITPRHNNGQGAVLKIKNHGYRRLKDIGYMEACEYRNCQRPVDPKYTTRDYGGYCGREHMVLVIADQEAIILDQVDNPGVRLLSDQDYKKAKRRRENLLRQATVEVGAASA